MAEVRTALILAEPAHDSVSAAGPDGCLNLVSSRSPRRAVRLGRFYEGAWGAMKQVRPT